MSKHSALRLTMSFLSHLFARFRDDPNKRRLRDGETLLASAQGDQVIAFTFDVALSHAEFVRRELGTLPNGAWVGTIRKVSRQVVAINSKTFYGNQLTAAIPRS